jgi:hypothetical protein
MDCCLSFLCFQFTFMLMNSGYGVLMFSLLVNLYEASFVSDTKYESWIS